MTSPPSPQPKQWQNCRGRGDVEGRGLLVVERAQALQRAAAGVAQRDVGGDHVVDARLLAHLGDVLLADPPGHVAESTGRPTGRLHRRHREPRGARHPSASREVHAAALGGVEPRS